MTADLSIQYSTRVDCHFCSSSKVGSKFNRRIKPLSQGSESQEPVVWSARFSLFFRCR